MTCPKCGEDPRLDATCELKAVKVPGQDPPDPDNPPECELTAADAQALALRYG